MAPLSSIQIPFGEKLLSIKLPEEKVAWICSPQEVPGVSDISAEVNRALDNLIGCTDLSSIVRQKGTKTVVLLDDDTRSTPQKIILPILLNKLNACGVRDEDITGIIAVGTHHYMSEEACRIRYGEETMGRIKIIHHQCSNPQELVNLGTTELGIPISVNRMFYESDISIAVGNIIPHIYAGWSGGAKMVQPGVSGTSTTSGTHLVAAPSFPKILGTVDNPVRREMEEVARKAGLTLIVNTVLNGRGEIVKVVAGDVVLAHREGVKYARKIYSFEFDEFVDFLIVGSHPADKDFWQAIKAYTTASLMIKPGGTMIFVSPCWEGVSPDHPTLYASGQEPYEKLLEQAVNGDIADGVGVATYSALSIARSRIGRTIFVTQGISSQELAHLGFELADSLQNSVSEVLNALGPQCRIGVVTHGADMVPVKI